MTGRRGDRAAIAADLELVYAGCPGLVAVTTLPGAATKCFRTDELAKMAAHVTARSATANVYVMVATLGARPARGRGGAADTLALPGLVLDLDIAGAAHAGRYEYRVGYRRSTWGSMTGTKSRTFARPLDAAQFLAKLSSHDRPDLGAVEVVVSRRQVGRWQSFDLDGANR